jgi:carboxyl-terminal processing protease
MGNSVCVSLQAWRAVDRAYVDKNFNGQSWFRVREMYLKKENMRTREETYTAIKKLLASLGDPFTRFLDPDQYDQLKRGTSGAVTGVGLEVAFAQKSDPQGPPQLMVRCGRSPNMSATHTHITAGHTDEYCTWSCRLWKLKWCRW